MPDTSTKPAVDLGFDPHALKAKYKAERDKRLRSEGNDQYVDVSGQYAHYLDDPYVEPGFTRDAVIEDVDAVVIGGGFAGILAAGRLKQAGVSDLRIIERAGDFGGTWYWNRYPGAACDVESYIYLPLLEEIGYMPKRKYADAPEILAHAQAMGRHFDIYKHALFQTQVSDVRWDEAAARWIVETDRHDLIRARFVVIGAGPLNRPKLPGIPGIETFKGHAFHTARWDYDYTGGTSLGGLDKLGDKVVGIIGTGATAVQCIPHLAKGAKHLYVFQRTPSSVDVRDDRSTDPTWAASLKPGWQRHRMINFETLVNGGFAEEDLVNDGWTEIIRNLLMISVARQQAGEGAPANPAELLQLADFKKMESIRARVDAIVKDKKTAEALKPYYNQFCKRPCFHDDFLPSFNRKNVMLVDTGGKGVERIGEHSVVVDGEEYRVDCLVYASGFEVGTTFAHRAGFEVTGRDGVTITEHWADGLRTLHGLQTRSFPNCFFIGGGAQSAITVNIPFMADEQSKHIAKLMKRCLDAQVRSIEITQAAEDSWQDEMRAKSRSREAFLTECTPGYYNNEGQVNDNARFSGAYGGGPFEYMRILETWQDGGFERDLEVAPASPRDRRRRAGRRRHSS